MTLAFPLGLAACAALVVAGSAVQVAVGAGLSVICGPVMVLWLGPQTGVPILLGLNLLVSVAATLCDGRGLRWSDAGIASAATLAGCGLASVVPGLSDAVLKLATAGVLVVVALPRPPAPDMPPAVASVALGITLAGLVTGALTVWTATPGPIIPIALARAGRSGSEIRRTMQPISTVGYGAALALVGVPSARALPAGSLLILVAATMSGVAIGFILRFRVDAARVVLLIRAVAAAAATLLVVSVAVR